MYENENKRTETSSVADECRCKSLWESVTFICLFHLFLFKNMATMDIRPFRKVVDNIVDSLGSAAKGEFDDGISLGEWTNRIIQLGE